LQQNLLIHILELQDNIGQFINLKYEVLEFEKTNDLCRGKPATMNSNTTGNQLSPSAGIYYAVNATDGDLRSNARAGGEYAWTLIVDLLEIQKVGRVKVVFETEVFSTNYKVYTSLDGISLNVVGERVTNNVQNGVFLFDPVATRYILVRSFQPSAQNQYGGQMSVRSLEAYAE
jgi:hypothetical protein